MFAQLPCPLVKFIGSLSLVRSLHLLYSSGASIIEYFHSNFLFLVVEQATFDSELHRSYRVSHNTRNFVSTALSVKVAT